MQYHLSAPNDDVHCKLERTWSQKTYYISHSQTQPDMAITSQRDTLLSPAQPKIVCVVYLEKNEGDLEICHDFFGFGNFKHILSFSLAYQIFTI